MPRAPWNKSAKSKELREEVERECGGRTEFFQQQSHRQQELFNNYRLMRKADGSPKYTEGVASRMAWESVLAELIRTRPERGMLSPSEEELLKEDPFYASSMQDRRPDVVEAILWAVQAWGQVGVERLKHCQSPEAWVIYEDGKKDPKFRQWAFKYLADREIPVEKAVEEEDQELSLEDLLPSRRDAG